MSAEPSSPRERPKSQGPNHKSQLGPNKERDRARSYGRPLGALDARPNSTQMPPTPVLPSSPAFSPPQNITPTRSSLSEGNQCSHLGHQRKSVLLPSQALSPRKPDTAPTPSKIAQNTDPSALSPRQSVHKPEALAQPAFPNQPPKKPPLTNPITPPRLIPQNPGISLSQGTPRQPINQKTFQLNLAPALSPNLSQSAPGALSPLRIQSPPLNPIPQTLSTSPRKIDNSPAQATISPRNPFAQTITSPRASGFVVPQGTNLSAPMIPGGTKLPAPMNPTPTNPAPLNHTNNLFKPTQKLPQHSTSLHNDPAKVEPQSYPAPHKENVLTPSLIPPLAQSGTFTPYHPIPSPVPFQKSPGLSQSLSPDRTTLQLPVPLARPPSFSSPIKDTQTTYQSSTTLQIPSQSASPTLVQKETTQSSPLAFQLTHSAPQQQVISTPIHPPLAQSGPASLQTPPTPKDHSLGGIQGLVQQGTGMAPPPFFSPSSLPKKPPVTIQGPAPVFNPTQILPPTTKEITSPLAQPLHVKQHKTLATPPQNIPKTNPQSARLSSISSRCVIHLMGNCTCGENEASITLIDVNRDSPPQTPTPAATPISSPNKPTTSTSPLAFANKPGQSSQPFQLQALNDKIKSDSSKNSMHLPLHLSKPTPGSSLSASPQKSAPRVGLTFQASEPKTGTGSALSLPMTNPLGESNSRFTIRMEANQKFQFPPFDEPPVPKTETMNPVPTQQRGPEELCRFALAGYYEEFLHLYRELPKYAINLPNSRGQTPLICAASRERTKILIEILNSDVVDINAPAGEHGETALHICTYHGYEECMSTFGVPPTLFTLTKKLPERIFAGDCSFPRQRSAPEFTIVGLITTGNTKIIYDAFQKDAPPQARRDLVNSFLNRGEWYHIRKLKAISFFLMPARDELKFEEMYPDFQAPQKRDDVPEDEACIFLPNFHSERLRSKEAMRDTVAEFVFSMRSWNGNKNQLETTMSLVHNLTCETVNLPGNEQCHSPLYAAARSGSVELVLAILQIPGVDPNITTFGGHTPLHVAAYEGHAEVTALLLIAGADSNALNQYKRSPIDDARKGAVSVFTMYKERGRAEVIRNWPRTKQLNYRFENLSPFQKEAEFHLLCKVSLEFQKKVPFPIQTNTINALATTYARQIQIIEFAASCRIIVHAKVRKLITSFLEIKKDLGSRIEKAIYTKMDVESFIHRLIVKRPLTFFGITDVTILRDLSQPDGNHWNLVGKDTEGKIQMEDYLTYDEMAISALIGTSCPTFFLNSGGRKNAGVPGPPSDFPYPGIYVGLVGARFEKKDRMESLYLLIQEEREMTPEEDALFKMWSDFYGRWLPSYSQLKEFSEEDMKLYPTVDVLYSSDNPVFFNIGVYQKRMELTVETFLAEANDRGMIMNKRVYCHIVGLGLGAWQVSKKQADWMLEVFETTLKAYTFSHLSALDFSWFTPSQQQFSACDENGFFNYANNNIQIIFSKRNPAEPLTGEHADKLLIAMYAWDSNSYPGNEYWASHFCNSGDPAAICCSLLQELQNPDINLHLLNNVFWLDPCGNSKPETTASSFDFKKIEAKI